MTAAPTTLPIANDAERGSHCVQRMVGRHSSATLYHGDCLEILRELRGLDCIVTSPPYNQKLDQFRASGMQAEWKVCERMASAYSDSRDETEYASEQVTMLDLCHDATTETASLFYNHKVRWRDKKVLHPLDIVRASLWELRQEIIWLRDGSMTQNAKMFPPCEERIYWMHKGEWHWNQKANEWMSVWGINSDKKSAHPVGFPVSLPYRAIMATTLPGQTVCDPYMGGGTTGLACLRNGRNFVGIEKDKRHFETACEQMRLEIEETLL